METVADPGLQRWFVESRSRVGVNIVPIRDARRALLRALRRHESVGMVADRDMLGNGLLVPFFGHPTPIPAGPALLAIEAGVPVYAGSARRAKGGRYRGRLIAGAHPRGGIAPGADRRADRFDRGGLRVDPRRRTRAVVGRISPDLAGSRAA